MGKAIAGLALAAAALVVELIAAWLLFAPLSEGTGTQTPPNFVVIVTDDLSKRMYDDSTNLRQGSETVGIEFTNAFAPTPNCCPARATILTGRYTHNHHVWQNKWQTDDGKLLYGGERMFLERGLENYTVAYRLKNQAGYTTSLMGKYLNGYGDNDGGPNGDDPNAPPDEPHEDGSYKTRVPEGWSDWHAWVGGGLTMNDNGVLTCTADNQPGNCPDGTSQPTATDYHQTDVLKSKAKAFVKDHAGQGNPFFLYIADRVPHNENPPADRHVGSHEDAALPQPPNFNEADVSDKPGYISRDDPMPDQQDGCASIDDTADSKCWNSKEYSQHYWRSGLEGLESVNELYDGIVATLRTTGELDNTYIFFVSDNGIHLGEHRQPYGKNSPYFEDINIPFNVRGPGIPQDVELPHLVGLQDLAPTIMDLAGLSIPSGMDGRSLKPLFSDTPPPESSWRKRMLIEGYEGGGANKQKSSPDDTPEWSGVVTYDRKYAEYVTGEEELYDLNTDPYELTNTASSNPAAVTDLHNYLTNLKSCAGSTCRSAEDD